MAGFEGTDKSLLDKGFSRLLGTPAQSVAFIIALYMLVWFLAQAAFFHAPRRDTVEIMALAPYWPMGMSKHPTLPSWMQEIAYILTGRATASTYALSMLCMGGTLYFVWKLAVAMTTRQIAVLAVAISLANYYFATPVTQFNHNTPSLLFSAALVYFYRDAILTDRTRSWLLIGLLSACLILTKYSGAFLLATLALHALFFPSGRDKLLRIGPYLALALFGLLMAPHILWLLASEFSPFRYAFEGQAEAVSLIERIWIGVSFILSQVGFHAGMLVVLIAVAIRPRRDAKPVIVDNPRVTPFDLSLVLSATLGPVLINAAISAVGGVPARPEWGGAYFALSGLALMLLLPRRLRIFNPRLAVLVLGGALFILPVAAVIGPYFTRPTHPTLYPAAEVAAAVDELWAAQSEGRPLRYLIGPGDAGIFAAAILLGPIPIVVDGRAPERSLMAFDMDDLREQGGVLIWYTGGAAPLPDDGPLSPEALGVDPAVLAAGATRISARRHSWIGDVYVNLSIAVLPPATR